jgi:hypothetical protein
MWEREPTTSTPPLNRGASVGKKWTPPVSPTPTPVPVKKEPLYKKKETVYTPPPREEPKYTPQPIKEEPLYTPPPREEPVYTPPPRSPSPVRETKPHKVKSIFDSDSEDDEPVQEQPKPEPVKVEPPKIKSIFDDSDGEDEPVAKPEPVKVYTPEPKYTPPPREEPKYTSPPREQPVYTPPPREEPKYTPPPRSPSPDYKPPRERFVPPEISQEDDEDGSTIVEISDRISIGSRYDVAKYAVLNKRRITHLIQLRTRDELKFEDEFTRTEYGRFTNRSWIVKDESSFEIFDLFDIFINYIMRILNASARNRVLIWDASGTCLSPTLMTAYLLREKEMHLDEAIDIVKKGSKNNVRINKGFMEQLEDYDLDLEDERNEAAGK